MPAHIGSPPWELPQAFQKHWWSWDLALLRTFLDLIDLIRDKPVGLAMHPLRQILVWSLYEAEDLPVSVSYQYFR